MARHTGSVRGLGHAGGARNFGVPPLPPWNTTNKDRPVGAEEEGRERVDEEAGVKEILSNKFMSPRYNQNLNSKF